MKSPPTASRALPRLACALAASLAAASCLLSRPPHAAQATSAAAVEPSARAAIEVAFSAPGPLWMDGAPVDIDALRSVYEERGYAPFWITGSGAVDSRVFQITEVLADAATEGLDPQRYHCDRIRRRLSDDEPRERARLELLVSDGILRYADHQTRGVSPPPPGDREAAFDQPEFIAGETLLSLAHAADPAQELRSMAPPVAEYGRLREALAVYRKIDSAGGWPTIPAGETLRLGTSSAAIPLLRRRLLLSGDLQSETTRSSRYDAALALGVRRFQERHGLGRDGSVGDATRTALNVSVRERIDQILVNMERWRWLGGGLGDRYVKINIPAATLELVEQGVPLLVMRVVVGKTTWRTPEFSSAIRQIVFNPTWFVPPRIAEDEILPKARANADYLSREGIIVRRISLPEPARDGDAPRASTREILRLRGLPGPKNPLGRVKFEMANPFGVYLHDTPSRRGFSRPTRALSHGCVRLENALGLAEALLAGTEGWNDERRQRILASWTTRPIPLSDPLPVHVLYETAWSDDSGTVHFRSDVYGRDEMLRKRMSETKLLRPSSLTRAQVSANPPPPALP